MSQTEKSYNVLFLCTGNSARSILAEAILRSRGQSRFEAFSAGSHPKGRVHPVALEILREHGCEPDDFRSKCWEEFADPGAPRLDFVFTVCDDAAGEACPIWPGRPVTAHWGMPDPAAAPPERQREAFERTWALLEKRIDRFANLPINALDRSTLETRTEAIGRPTSAGPEE